ncbi:MAG: methionine--tRNA ligase [Patescibacteria group bacterium]
MSIKAKKKFYITTPIYYTNDEPHIGHTYTTIAADVLARFHRMIGDKTFFLTGTDEHGEKNQEAAEKNGLKPKEYVDQVSAKYQMTWDLLNISNNRFIRTTEKEHKKAVSKALQQMYDKKYIYKGKFEGLYCKGCEQYKTEKDLVKGKCSDHKTVPVKMKEESYMFKLSAFEKKLKKMIEKDELLIRPIEKKNEVLAFYKTGLKDISFSRSKLKWGVPLPWDPKQVSYVWPDAFLNYITGLNWDGGKTKSVRTASSGSVTTAFKDFWPADVHLMSKDIIRVHATIWPAMLLALDLPLPKQIFVHGFFLIDGQKMSKSIGNVISPDDLVKKYGVDGTRYLLMSATTFGHDGDISWKWFDEKYNADLANGLGNLIARSATLAEKMEKAEIKIPACTKRPKSNTGIKKWGGNKFDKEIIKMWKDYNNYYENIKLDSVINVILEQQRCLDNYITANKPWELIKNKDEKVGIIMYNILERLRHVALMAWPFMPETAEKIWESLGLEPSKEMEKDFKEAIKWGGLEPGTKIRKGEVLFPRIKI